MNDEQEFKGQGIAIAPSPEGVPNERRRFRRSNLLSGVQVAWHYRKAFFVSNISDISLGGAFILTPEPPPVGASLKLLFDVPGKELQASGVVRRSVSGQGMSIEFVEMESNDRACLQSLLEAAARSESHGRAGVVTQESNLPTPLIEASRQTKPVATPKAPVTNSPRVRGSERRAHLRYEFIALTEIIEKDSGERTKEQLISLSRGGCYLKTAKPQSVGATLTVVITKGTKSFQAQAQVTSAVPGQGMGLMFTMVEPTDLQTLDKWLETAQEQVWLVSNRRKGHRLKLVIPVKVVGTNHSGASFTEDANTIIISAYGALISLRTAMDKGQILTLSNLHTRATIDCAVVYVGQVQGDQSEVGVAFALPTKAFWGIAFPPSNWSRRHPDAK